MKPRMALGDFLVAYLKRAGVTHIFGLPGDLVLGLFHRFGSARGLEIVTFSHEPAVGFAADGYARSTRRLGVVCVTYGVGGYNVVNPVAGAYAEQIPLLVVSGGPGEAEQKLAGVHHQAKDVEGQLRVFDAVTCTARWLRHPERAAEEIHEVVSTIMAEHRPGYALAREFSTDPLIYRLDLERIWRRAWLFAGHWSRFAINFAAALPAKVVIIFLGGRHQPKTTARLAQDSGTQQPFVESDLIFYPHRVPLFAAKSGFRALRVLNDKRRDSFNKVWQLRCGK